MFKTMYTFIGLNKVMYTTYLKRDYLHVSHFKVLYKLMEPVISTDRCSTDLKFADLLNGPVFPEFVKYIGIFYMHLCCLYIDYVVCL